MPPALVEPVVPAVAALLLLLLVLLLLLHLLLVVPLVVGVVAAAAAAAVVILLGVVVSDLRIRVSVRDASRALGSVVPASLLKNYTKVLHFFLLDELGVGCYPTVAQRTKYGAQERSLLSFLLYATDYKDAIEKGKETSLICRHTQTGKTQLTLQLSFPSFSSA